MNKWLGAAAVCVNENEELLMIQQGRPEEEKLWSVPSGGVEQGETFEDCCVREVYEETGYHVEVLGEIHSKKNDVAEVKYFHVKVTGGKPTLHDPDELIQDIAWRKIDDVPYPDIQYKEDIEFLKAFVKEKVR